MFTPLSAVKLISHRMDKTLPALVKVVAMGASVKRLLKWLSFFIALNWICQVFAQHTRHWISTIIEYFAEDILPIKNFSLAFGWIRAYHTSTQ